LKNLCSKLHCQEGFNLVFLFMQHHAYCLRALQGAWFRIQGFGGSVGFAEMGTDEFLMPPDGAALEDVTPRIPQDQRYALP